jgi:hypothetical protein
LKELLNLDYERRTEEKMPPRKRRNRDEEEDDDDEEDYQDDEGDEVMTTPSSSTRTPRSRNPSSAAQATPSTRQKASRAQDESNEDVGTADLGEQYELDRSQFSQSALNERKQHLQDLSSQISQERNEDHKHVKTALDELDKSGLKTIDLHQFVGSLPGSEQLQNDLMEASKKLQDTQWKIIQQHATNNDFDTARYVAERFAQTDTVSSTYPTGVSLDDCQTYLYY